MKITIARRLKMSNQCTCTACQASALMLEVIASDLPTTDKETYVQELNEVILDNLNGGMYAVN
jgi:hypothetical protein